MAPYSNAESESNEISLSHKNSLSKDLKNKAPYGNDHLEEVYSNETESHNQSSSDNEKRRSGFHSHKK